jgi:putative ABC transport system permease protein
MFKNNLKIFIRNFKKQKSYTLINLLGLAIGMVSFLLIFLYIGFEFSYDRFHKNASLLYRVRNDRIYSDIHDKSAGCPPAIGPALKDEFPEVIETARIYPQSGKTMTYHSGTNVISHIEERIFYAEDSFLKMFSFPIIKSSTENLLSEPNTAVITESVAIRYFGNEDPLDKIIEGQNRFGKQLFRITGILKDVPENSHVKFDILLSFKNFEEETLKDQGRSINNIWGWNAFNTYVLLNSASRPGELESRFPAFIERHDLNDQDYRRALSLQPIKDIHLHSHLRWEPEANGNAKTVYYLCIIAIFILLVAWINYINLATAKSVSRAKEIGVRKVLGSRRIELIKQFVFEAFLLNILALAIAIVALEISLPGFAAFTGKPIVLSFANTVWIWLGLSIIIGSVLSGIYPAFVLSSFNPASVLKGNIKNSAKGFVLRKSLVVLQFVISVMLILSTIIVYRQVTFMTNQDLGMNIDQVLVIESSSQQNTANVQKFKNDLLSYPSIKKLSLSSTIPGKEYSNISSGIRPLESNPEDGKRCFFIDVDQAFFDLFEIELLAGRNFTENLQYYKSVILNEQAVKILGFGDAKNAVNKKVLLGGLGERIVDVIGIVRDFHQKSLNNQIEPIIFNPIRDIRYFSVKIDAQNIDQTMSIVKKTWKNNFPDQPFEYNFLDDVFNAQYKSDQQFGKIFGFFTILAIFISCLGLFGLISFSFAQRTKEIGVRKVLGASLGSVVLLLTQELIKLVLIAALVAWPIAWYAMNKWLQNFAYRIEMSWWMFALAGVMALVIALLTVSWQAIRAATANPVEALRYE